MTDTPIVRQFAAVVIDANDLATMATFWGKLIGEPPGPVRGDAGWVTIGTLASGAHLVLQKVTEQKAVKDRVHIDFIVDDVDTAVSEIETLGGKLLSGPRPGGGVTMADPEGNEFCIGSFTRDKQGKRSRLR